MQQAGTLGEHSNSFLIALSDNQATIDSLCDFDAEIYEPQTLNYETPIALTNAKAVGQLDRDLQLHLNAQITQLQSHSDNLQSKVDIMSNSIGWRLLNGVRRLFGKTTL